jgi:hypothetical protein
MPILAMGGAESGGGMAADTMKLVADDVQTLVIPGVGHWLAEQAPAHVAPGGWWRRRQSSPRPFSVGAGDGVLSPPHESGSP